MCDDFAKIMHDEFEISMMGELKNLLGLQIKQLEDGIFFNQSKSIKEMLKKFRLENSKPMKTPISTETKLTKDVEGEFVDNTKYRENPKTSYLEAVKRIFRYIKGTMNLGLWYLKGSGIETIVYADSDYAGYYVDRKSTSGICTFMGCCLTSWFSKKQTTLAISTTEVEYIDSSLAVPLFKQGDDPIEAINKTMSFFSTIVLSRFPATNNQLRNSSNLRQQAIIHDGMVNVQPVQGRQSSFAAGTSGTKANISGILPKANRKRDATWFKDKVLLVESQGSDKVLNEEELEFLADPRVAKGPVTQTVNIHNAAYQADDLDAYDSDCDDFSIAKVVLMANLSSYGADVLSEAPQSEKLILIC
nr:uncharacterized mitochondrial protein AtMg00810-like [Tanacetum cinerariifolium]